MRRLHRDDALKAAPRDQFAAGAVIDCNWSITNSPTCNSTATQPPQLMPDHEAETRAQLQQEQLHFADDRRLQVTFLPSVA